MIFPKVIHTCLYHSIKSLGLQQHTLYMQHLEIERALIWLSYRGPVSGGRVTVSLLELKTPNYVLPM